LALVVEHLERAYDAYLQDGFGALAGAFRARSDLVGRSVELVMPEGVISGTVLDLDLEGALLLATGAGQRRVRVGEASLRLG
jgi:biotin-(acetyl-CoA carboxylase) ligase